MLRTIVEAAIGFVVPIRLSSRLYLIDQLNENGVEANAIPLACLREFADLAVEDTKRLWAPRGWKSHVTTTIEGQAMLIKWAMEGTSGGGAYNNLRAVLRKHGVAIKGSDTDRS
jgi:hypothetical protein